VVEDGRVNGGDGGRMESFLAGVKSRELERRKQDFAVGIGGREP